MDLIKVTLLVERVSGASRHSPLLKERHKRPN